MILADASAWIEFLRDSGSPPCLAVHHLLASRELAVSEPVAMEVVAGARDERHAQRLTRLLAMTSLVACDPKDYGVAAALYRRCRAKGHTVRRLLDCLVAAVAIRHDVPVLHADRDFDALERYTELRIHHA